MKNVITLSKLIDLLLLFCPPTSLFCLKNTRNELARPVMGTIFLVIYLLGFYTWGKGGFQSNIVTRLGLFLVVVY